jgi:hypothetical protein
MRLGTKLVCFECRHVGKARRDSRFDLRRCPHCRKPLTVVGPNPRIPPKRNDRAWAAFERWWFQPQHFDYEQAKARLFFRQHPRSRTGKDGRSGRAKYAATAAAFSAYARDLG